MPWREVSGGYTKARQKDGGFVRNPKQYAKLRKLGMSKERAAMITNSDNVTKALEETGLRRLAATGPTVARARKLEGAFHRKAYQAIAASTHGPASWAPNAQRAAASRMYLASRAGDIARRSEGKASEVAQYVVVRPEHSRPRAGHDPFSKERAAMITNSSAVQKALWPKRGARKLAHFQAQHDDLQRRLSAARGEHQDLLHENKMLHARKRDLEEGRGTEGLGKAFDSERQRHRRLAAYEGGAAGGSVVAGASTRSLYRRARSTERAANTKRSEAIATHRDVQTQLHRMAQPTASTGSLSSSKQSISGAARLHREAVGQNHEALGLYHAARNARRAGRAGAIGTAALGATAYGLHREQRRDRSFGYR